MRIFAKGLKTDRAAGVNTARVARGSFYVVNGAS